MTDYPYERRSEKRIVAMLLCEIECPGMPVAVVRIRDLSDTGMRIALRDFSLPGPFVRIRLPGCEHWKTAKVAWRHDGLAGLSFRRAFRAHMDPPRVSDEKLQRLES